MRREEGVREWGRHVRCPLPRAVGQDGRRRPRCWPGARGLRRRRSPPWRRGGGRGRGCPPRGGSTPWHGPRRPRSPGTGPTTAPGHRHRTRPRSAPTRGACPSWRACVGSPRGGRLPSGSAASPPARRRSTPGRQRTQSGCPACSPGPVSAPRAARAATVRRRGTARSACQSGRHREAGWRRRPTGPAAPPPWRPAPRAPHPPPCAGRAHPARVACWPSTPRPRPGGVT